MHTTFGQTAYRAVHAHVCTYTEIYKYEYIYEVLQKCPIVGILRFRRKNVPVAEFFLPGGANWSLKIHMQALGICPRAFHSMLLHFFLFNSLHAFLTYFREMGNYTLSMYVHCT
jgi:hypothetical protein